MKTIQQYNIIRNGTMFGDSLLCSVYARTMAEAQKLAAKEVEEGDIYTVVLSTAPSFYPELSDYSNV